MARNDTKLPNREVTAERLDDWSEGTDDHDRYNDFYDIIQAYVEGELVPNLKPRDRTDA